MKRYLTVGIIFGILVAIIVTISWLAFPAWRDPASGGFLTLLGATIVGVLAFIQGGVSIWKDLKEEKEKKEEQKQPAPMQAIDSQKAEAIYNAPGGTINIVQHAKQSEPTDTLDSKNDIRLVGIAFKATGENARNQHTVVDGVNWETMSSSIVFDVRLQNAFPGLRGIENLNKEEAINRLQILLQNPLYFETSDGGQILPFWWLRGVSSAQIDKFEKIGADRILLDYFEMNIDHIVAVRKFPAEERNFVYVHIAPDEPTGLYKYDEGWLEQHLQYQLDNNFGYYYREEYGLWNNRLIRREEYDDGSAIIDGKPIKTFGAELRVRYITPYNFIICPQDHVLISQFPLSNTEEKTNKLMDEILLGAKEIEDLVSFVGSLPIHSHFK